MSKTIRRALKRALDTQELRIVTSDELLAMPPNTYQQLRRDITISAKTGAPRYLCSRCGHPVYAPNYSTGPGWKHYGSEPIDCEWWTGVSSSVDEVSARQFQGQQESPLHHNVKHLIADLLRADSRTEGVVVDEVLFGSTGYKKPDVRAKFDGRSVAVELQLSTTQIPIIVERELFYRREGWHLLWLTWDFEPRPYTEVRQAFRDIATAHRDNLFTLDTEAITESRRRGCLVLRVLWWREGVCENRLVALDDLVWSDEALPFAVAQPQSSVTGLLSKAAPSKLGTEKQTSMPTLQGEGFSSQQLELFKVRWVKAAKKFSPWELSENHLWLELQETIELDNLQRSRVETTTLIDVLNLAVSFDQGYPIGSQQSNLAELFVTFLAAEKRHPYAILAERLAVASGHAELLKRPSIQKKIAAAKQTKQVGGSSDAVKILTNLFPQWVKKNGRDLKT